MTAKNRMNLVSALTDSLNEKIKEYSKDNHGEYDWKTDKYPPTQTAIRRHIRIIREELLTLSKEL